MIDKCQTAIAARQAGGRLPLKSKLIEAPSVTVVASPPSCLSTTKSVLMSSDAKRDTFLKPKTLKKLATKSSCIREETQVKKLVGQRS